MDEKQHKKAIWAWTMYDWGNSAFVTTIMAAVLPVYYTSVAAAGLAPNIATAYWGFTSSISALIAAIISPVLGAVADFTGSKKRFLTVFMAIGVTATALLYFVQTGDWVLASLLFIFGQIGFAGSLVYYDGLLPHVARPDEIDQVSSRGYAMGYIGGGLLLAINLAMIMVLPATLGLDKALMTRLCFVTVSIWWFIFTLPLLRHVKEPPRRIEVGEENMKPLTASFSRLGQTFRDIRHYRDLSLGMLAFWVYANGIGTIIVMATAYGNELGFSQINPDRHPADGPVCGRAFCVPFRLVGKTSRDDPFHHHLVMCLYFNLLTWILHVPGMAVLGVGIVGSHGPGRQPGAQPLHDRQDDPEKQVC